MFVSIVDEGVRLQHLFFVGGCVGKEKAGSIDGSRFTVRSALTLLSLSLYLSLLFVLSFLVSLLSSSPLFSYCFVLLQTAKYLT